MSWMYLNFRATVARYALATALICALVVSQFGLIHHVVEHAASSTLKVSTSEITSNLPDNHKCLTCLEQQAHGASLISHFAIFVAQPMRTFELQALAPNTPYLTPERASQRAPPVLS